MKLLLLSVLPCTLPGYVASFALPTSIINSHNHNIVCSNYHRLSHSHLSAEPSNEIVDNEEEVESSESTPPIVSSNPGGSNLKALLPTPKKHTLKLDKFGRRVHDLTNDGTAKFSRELRGVSPEEYYNNVVDPSQSAVLKSEKELAAIASSADFSAGVSSSADLKALLPTQKMRFMKLDKFGRRIQRMEDDGTVNMKKEPTQQRPTAEVPYTNTPQPQDIKMKASQPQVSPVVKKSQSLAKLLNAQDRKVGRGGVINRENSDSVLAEGNEGPPPNYGSLRDLIPTRRPTWTKLDFKGGSVVDESRMKRMSGGGSVSGNAADVDVSKPLSGQGLKDLLPKRATWTKLDFHGASVVDERRTKQAGPRSERGSFNEGQYSNLTTLLPQRTITWKKDRVLSSGSAATVSENARGLRDDRQQAMRDEVIASASMNAASDDELAEDGEDIPIEEELKPYSNLKDLLPERKMTWRSTK